VRAAVDAVDHAAAVGVEQASNEPLRFAIDDLLLPRGQLDPPKMFAPGACGIKHGHALEKDLTSPHPGRFGIEMRLVGITTRIAWLHSRRTAG
jgi:hypothetical protein